MPAATAPHTTASPAVQTEEVKTAPPITWEVFQRRYLSKENSFKYEWVNGQVEKSPRGMDKSQLYIQANLLDFFFKLKAQKKVTGKLISEPDLFFLTSHRRPDLCWLTNAQITALANPGAYEVPAFVIEVISPNDHLVRVRRKLNDYRNAGVQVAWLIFPGSRQVEVFAGERLDRMALLEGEQVCSAAPALPAFEISVDAIFQLPVAE